MPQKRIRDTESISSDGIIKVKREDEKGLLGEKLGKTQPNEQQEKIEIEARKTRAQLKEDHKALVKSQKLKRR